MKKQFKAQLDDQRWASNPEFKALLGDFQNARKRLDDAKSARDEAKKAYRTAMNGGSRGEDHLQELLADFRKAKFMRQYQREDVRLAKSRLDRWMRRQAQPGAQAAPQAAEKPKPLARTRTKKNTPGANGK